MKIAELHAASSDARHQSVERMLERALESVRADHAQDTKPVKAILIIQWQTDTGTCIRPWGAGTSLTEALGLLRRGEHELLYPGD